MTNLLNASSERPIGLVLARDLVRSLRRGHPWVFADALKNSPPGQPGDHAVLRDKRGKVVARGYYDPTSPLRFRSCTVERGEVLDEPWIINKLEDALSLREALIDVTMTTGYRLLNGEGDALPGLVCDVYGHVAVIKCDGPAAEGFYNAKGIGQWLAERLELSCVYGRQRRRGDPSGEILVGTLPDAPVPFLEHGLSFLSDVVHGQKTGFFLDQRDNRERVRLLASDRDVLNVFGYTGGFSVYAAAGGAKAVTTVDIAQSAIDATTKHFHLNGLDGCPHEAVACDAFEFLDRAALDDRRWDLVILDPPSFAPNRKSAKNAGGAYERLVAAGARVTAPGGILIAASCSSHVSVEAFAQHVENGIGSARRRAIVIGIHQQPGDHPTPLPCREFRYLKLIYMRVS